jgi:hypothetical protein
MAMASSNLELLTNAAKLLEPLLGELVFVGGCATQLLITDKAAAAVRPTLDVDAIVEITSYAGYETFSERLRKLGFQEDASENAPRCRWRQKTTVLDVMPLDAKILGFSNSWYRPAMDHAEERELESGPKIRLVSLAYFCASKLAATPRVTDKLFFWSGTGKLESIVRSWQTGGRGNDTKRSAG